MKDIVFKTIMLKGEAGGTIVSIEKISETGSYDVLRITLDDGSTVDFQVLNTVDEDKVKTIISEQTTDLITEDDHAPVSSGGVYDAIDDLDTDLRSYIDTRPSWDYVGHFEAPNLSALQPYTIPQAYRNAYMYRVDALISISDTFKAILTFDFFNDIEFSGQGVSRKIQSYYYDASYNGMLVLEFDFVYHTLDLLDAWSHVNGTTSGETTIDLRVYASHNRAPAE